MDNKIQEMYGVLVAAGGMRPQPEVWVYETQIQEWVALWEVLNGVLTRISPTASREAVSSLCLAGVSRVTLSTLLDLSSFRHSLDDRDLDGLKSAVS